MNSQQRVTAALRLQQPDRVPVLTFLNPYTDNWASADPSYAPVMEAMREYGDTVYDWYCPSGFFCTAAEMPSETIQRDDGATTHVLHTPGGPITQITAANWQGSGIVKSWIATEEDAARVLSIPFELPRPDLRPFLETRRRLADKAIAQATFPDPICWVGGMVQPEVLAIWTIENRPLLRRLLDTALERTLKLLEYCLAGDVGPLYYFNGPEYALPPLMSPRDFDEFVVPYDKPLVDLVHSYPGRLVVIHSHGRVSRFLERFAAIGMDGLNVLEPPPMGDVDLSDAKRRIGRSVCLIGNIQYEDLARRGPREIASMVRQAITAGGAGGGFILCPCAAPYEQPLPFRTAENLVAFLRAGHEHGRY